MKILVIGGSGFFGIHMVNELLAKGHKYYNEFMWGRSYAKIITVEQAIQPLQGDVGI